MKRDLFLWLAGGWGLNFLWEMFQRPLYAGDPSFFGHLDECLAASLGDVVMLGFLFGLMASSAGTWRWYLGPPVRWVGLGAAGFVLAVAMELLALARGKWAYEEEMPLVPGFGVGWAPVLQMILIPALLSLISRKGFSRRGRKPTA